ncbi:MAG: hypothetical protein WBO34_14055 [Gammaproteobacteria bacterium]
MSNKKNHLFNIVYLLCACYVNVSVAETREEQEMQQALEMMKSQGMDPQQVQQMEGIMQNLMQMEAQKKNAELAKQTQAFEAETAGFGTATVEVEGKRYDLKVTECEVKDSQQGIFTIRARQAPGLDQGELSIYSNGVGRQQSVNFSTRTRPPSDYRADRPGLTLSDRSISWQGQVESNQRTLPFTLSLKCGAEAVFYDTASRERPDKPANIVTLYLGPETYEFELGRCSTEPYRNGNLEVFFEATATGSFRGRPAIVLLEGGREVAGTESEGAGEFHSLDLLLGEISPEQRQLSPYKLQKQLSDKVAAYQNKHLARHQEKYDNAYWNKLTPAEMVAAMQVAGAEMDVIMAQADAMRFPSADSHHGVITMHGQDIVFRGPAMRTSDAERAPELKNLSAMPEIFLSCGT